jgi:hypothetical protein
VDCFHALKSSSDPGGVASGTRGISWDMSTSSVGYARWTGCIFVIIGDFDSDEVKRSKITRIFQNL